MDKNWLIRTKSNHILGPISKEKVLELFHNGSIKPDDEVCSGNGYWFFIREDDMVARFLTGSEVQNFNPISEAKDVLTHSVKSPASEPVNDDITLVSGLNVSLLKQQSAMPDLASVPVSDAPPVPDAPSVEANAEATVAKESVVTETKKKNNLNHKAKASVTPRPSLKKQNYLKYLGIFGFLLLFLLVYYRKIIIRHLFQGEITATFSLISEAHGQEVLPEKKKSF